MNRMLPAGLCLAMAALLSAPALAQLPAATTLRMFVDTLTRKDSSQVVDTSYTVRVGGRTYLAISRLREEDNQKMDIDLELAQKEVAILRSDVQGLKEYKQLAEGTLRMADSLVVLYRENERDYRKLTRVYEKLAREEFLSVEGGLGITDITGGTHAALLLGAGFRNFRTWGFFQKDNTGVAVGAHFPLLRF